MGDSTTRLEFLRARDELLESKPGQTARYLAEELVRLMELVAVHGSSGVDGAPDKREAYIQILERRISNCRGRS